MRYKINEIAEIIDGDRGKNYPKQKDFQDTGFCLFLDTGNVTKSGFSFETNHFITEEKCNVLRNGKMKRGDIAYTTRGTVGNVAFFSLSVPFEHIRINSGMIILRVKEKIASAPFLYQVLKHDTYRTYFKQYCTGSAQPQLPIKNFSKIELDLPDRHTQDKIANILYTYDELIENNKKQIKLLEEAAQRLYKEWFIDLHGGWKEGTLGDIVEFKRGKTITKADVTEGPIPVVAGGLEPAYYHNKANTTAPVITVSGSGANAGFARLYNENVFASDCSFADSTTTPYLFFVYCFLRANKSSLDSLQKGAAQPHVYAKDINNMKLLIPTNIEMGSFCGFVSPYFKKMKTLQIQINKLTQARDRLLPKLMSGEIEV